MTLAVAVIGELVPTLDECEEVIERGRATFVEVGLALKAIRDHRLYRETHGTFAAYVLDRWNFSRPRAYQLISAAEMSTTVDIRNEGQARRLRAVKETPSDTTTDAAWRELLAVMDAIEQLGRIDATEIAAVVPRRRNAATAKRLRKLGTYLGRIAWLLEGTEDEK